jgi:hypothetical protein
MTTFVLFHGGWVGPAAATGHSDSSGEIFVAKLANWGIQGTETRFRARPLSPVEY